MIKEKKSLAKRRGVVETSISCYEMMFHIFTHAL